MYSHYGKLCSEFYDFTKPVGKSISGDIEYYLERLKDTTGRILEAGVGTGRMLIPLFEKGFVVDGIDSSSDMLEYCKKNCKKYRFNPNLYHMKLEDMQLPYKYEAIIMPTGSFCLLETRTAAIHTLYQFKDHLSDGGRLIFDIELPSQFKEGDIFSTAINLSDREGITLESKSIEMDWINQKTITQIKYEKWCEGKLVDTELQQFVMSWYGIEEMKMILEEIGFQNISFSSGYLYNYFPANADGIITVEAVK